jgi:hypothetical protein
LSSNGAGPAKARQPILFANQLWLQQRWYAGFLILLGLVAPILLLVFRQPLQPNWVWFIYAPSGLLLGGGFLLYRARSYVETRDDGLKVSTLFSSALIGYDAIRQVRVQPLRNAYQDKRRRIAPVMKPLLDKPALFVRLKGDETELAAVKKSLGSRLFYDDEYIAMPVPDPDAAAWEITSRLPDRMGHNLGGKRRKRRR